MRRRVKENRFGLPGRLETYREADWVGRDSAEKYGAWYRARSEWADAHGFDVLPGDQEAMEKYPDGVFRMEDI